MTWQQPQTRPRVTFHLAVGATGPSYPLCRSWFAFHSPHQSWILDPERVTCVDCRRLMGEGRTA